MSMRLQYSSLCLSLLLCAIPSRAADDSFSRATALYDQKKYAPALPLFIQELKNNPRNAAAYLYIANSYYLLGQINPAKQTYALITKSFPGTKQAAAAAAFLNRLQPAANQNSVSPPSRVAPGAVPYEKTKLSSIIQIVRPQQDHPAVSSTLTDSVEDKLNKYPPSVKSMFLSHGIHVYLTTTLIDKNPELKNREGRGYDGYTYKSCPGMFSDNQDIVICERTMDEASEAIHEPMPLADIINTLNHESGHAIDHCLGDLSETDEFKHAYLLDAAKIEPETRNDLSYYLQQSVAGQEECCGELIGIILGSQDRQTDKLKTAFPQTIRLLRTKLGMP